MGSVRWHELLVTKVCPSPSARARRLCLVPLGRTFSPHPSPCFPPSPGSHHMERTPINSGVPLPGGCRAGHRLSDSRKAPWLLPGVWQSPAWLCSGTFAVDPTSFVFKLHSGQKVRNLLVGLFFFFPSTWQVEGSKISNELGKQPDGRSKRGVGVSHYLSAGLWPGLGSRRFFSAKMLPFSPE